MSHHRPAGHRRRLSLAAIRKHLPPLALLATLGFVAAVLALALLVRPAHAASRVLAESYDSGSADRFEFDVPYGDLKIEGVDGGRVRVRVEATCERDRHCDDYLENMRLEVARRGHTLRVKLRMAKMHAGLNLDIDDEDDDRSSNEWGDRGRSHGHDSNIRVTILVPRSLALDLNVGAGDVAIAGLRHDVSIDMGAGEITVRMPERVVRGVEVNVAVGETVIRRGGHTREYARLLGGPVRWNDGRGDAGIEVNLGAGEVDVTLE